MLSTVWVQLLLIWSEDLLPSWHFDPDHVIRVPEHVIHAFQFMKWNCSLLFSRCLVYEKPVTALCQDWDLCNAAVSSVRERSG